MPQSDRPQPTAGPSGSVRLHNYSVIQADSVAMGIVNASTPHDELMKRVPARHGVTFTSVDYTVQNVALDEVTTRRRRSAGRRAG